VNAEKPVGGAKANAYLIFDYYSPTDFKFAGINVATNKFEMGERTASGWYVNVQAPLQVKPDAYYNLLLAVNGTTATLVMDGKNIFSSTFAPRVVDGASYNLNTGMIGVGSRSSVGIFDNVTVQRVAPETTYTSTEDFTDDAADLFTGLQAGTWQVANGRYDSLGPGRSRTAGMTACPRRAATGQ